MVKLNSHFSYLSSTSLFHEIDKRVAAAAAGRPETVMINLGLDDTVKPLPPTLLAALCSACQEMGDRHTFRGYGPSQGYPFLLEAIAYGEYRHLGIAADEIFVSNGARCDLTQILELFDADNRIALCAPVFPIYFESAALAGRPPEEIQYIPCLEENGFIPLPPSAKCDLIFLSSPNNPTGAAIDRRTLRLWVDFALENHAVIIFDGSYEAYISSDRCPHSIYEIEGAKEVAIEIRSFSKTAGFTNLRCSYSVVPKELRAPLNGQEVSLHSLWRRRQDAKFGGVPYPIQKCAAAIYTAQGSREVQNIVQIYKDRAAFLLKGLQKLSFTVFGGQDAPYLWCKTPNGMASWEFFDHLLHRQQIVCIPGRSFGPHGEGFVRFSAFPEPTQLAETLLRLKKLYTNYLKNREFDKEAP